MQKTFTLKLLPSEAANPDVVKTYIASATGFSIQEISGYNITRSSIDARSRTSWINLQIHAFINEPWQPRELMKFQFREVNHSIHSVVVVGAGPAGLFAALKLIESGIKPIIVERGKEVRDRRRDLALLNKHGEINPDSNYCFGEGGAGTYSDGKLYTRSTKRGDINRILNLFVRFGAEEKILYESHPHIGTNKLPQIIIAMRETITAHGGQLHFNSTVIDFVINNDSVKGVILKDGEKLMADAVIIATGHSARDIFKCLEANKIKIDFKPFALGVRVEHPQSLIDSIQYHCPVRGDFLPPASYSLVQQVKDRGVFSFCMCPGGIIAPAATDHGELVVNGWSPSKRNNPYANSGMVITVEEKDCFPFKGVLAGMKFQQRIEQSAFKAGGGKFKAPAQRLTDLIADKSSHTLPSCSYLPGLTATSMKEVLPDFIYTSLIEAFREFGKKMRGFVTEDAVVVAPESRTSSPVRIPRDNESLQHPQIANLYPCGEGAGYAGGIVSAAMDGERVAIKIAERFSRM